MINSIEELINAVKQSTSCTHVVFSSNEETHEVLFKLMVNNIPMKVVLGKYLGVYETSYLVAAEHLEFILHDRHLMRGQESVMLLSNIQKNGSRPAFLLYSDNYGSADNLSDLIEHIGLVTVTDQETAMNAEAFTYDTLDQTFFITTKGN